MIYDRLEGKAVQPIGAPWGRGTTPLSPLLCKERGAPLSNFEASTPSSVDSKPTGAPVVSFGLQYWL
jgi:hypothetical protein